MTNDLKLTLDPETKQLQEVDPYIAVINRLTFVLRDELRSLENTLPDCFITALASVAPCLSDISSSLKTIATNLCELEVRAINQR